MSDVLNAFKQESASRVAGRRKKREEEEQVQPQQKFQQDAQQKLLEQQQKQQQEAKQQESDNNVIRALAASQDNNVAQQSNKGSTEAERLAAAKAQDDAYNAQVDAYNSHVAEANRKAAEKQARAAEGKQDEGWKKYYNEEFEKEKPKNIWELIGSGHLFDDTFWDNTYRSMFDNGGTERRAEVNARNRYTSDLLNQAYDDNGNVLNDWAANQAKNVSEYNMNVALDNSKRSAALTKAIGADADENDIGARIRGTFNAVRNIDWGNPIAGVDINSNEFDGADAVRFFGGLLQGSASAPIVGVKNLQEAMSGKGLDKETGEDKDLSFGEIVGRTGSGLIDVAGPLIGGSGTLLKSLTKQGAKELGEQTLKQGVKKFVTDIGKEGLEEAVQSGFEHFGEGGKLETKEDWNELVNNALQSAALGAIGGGAMSAAGLGAGKLGTALKNRIRNNTKVDEKEIVDRLNKIKELENRSTNTETNNTNINNKEYTGDIIMPDGTTLNPKTNTPTITTPEYTGDPRARLANQSNEGDTLMANSPMNRLTNINENVAENYSNPNSPVTAAPQESGYASNPEINPQLANQEQYSATGQKINPQNYSEAVNDAIDTQAYNDVNKTTGTLGNRTLLEMNDDEKTAALLGDNWKTGYTEEQQNIIKNIISQLAIDFSDPQSVRRAIMNLRYYKGRKIHPSTRAAIGRKMFNSEENQAFLERLGFPDVRSGFDRSRGEDTSRTLGRYTMPDDNIQISTTLFNSLPEMQSTELHEVSHAVWSRMPTEQKLPILKDLFSKLGLDTNTVTEENLMKAYGAIDELVSEACQSKFEGDLGRVYVHQLSKENQKIIMDTFGIKDEGFITKLQNLVDAVATFIKAKVAKILKVQTFDEYYNAIINGRFKDALAVDITKVNNTANILGQLGDNFPEMKRRIREKPFYIPEFQKLMSNFETMDLRSEKGFDKAGDNLEKLYNLVGMDTPINRDAPSKTAPEVTLNESNYPGNTTLDQQFNQDRPYDIRSLSVDRSENGKAYASYETKPVKEPTPVEEPKPEPVQEPTPEPTETVQEPDVEPTEAPVEDYPEKPMHPILAAMRDGYNAKLEEIKTKIYDLGFTDDMAMRIQQASRNGEKITNVLDKREQKIYKEVLKLIDPKTANENFKKGYLPQQYDRDFGKRLASEAIVNGEFSDPYSKMRRGKVELDEMNNMDALADLILRRNHPELAQDLEIAAAVLEDNPNATDEQVKEGVKAGKEAIKGVKETEGKDVKQAGKRKSYFHFNQYGKYIGMEQIEDNTRIQKFASSDYEAVSKTDHYKNGLSFDLIVNKTAYAQLSRPELEQLIEKRMPFVSKKRIEQASAKANQVYQDILETTKSEKYAELEANRAFIGMCAYTNLVNGSKKINFTNPNTAKFFDRLISERLNIEEMRESAVQEMGKLIQRAMNSSFRGLRLTTTLNELGEVPKIWDFGKPTLTFNPRVIREIKARYGMATTDTGELGISSLIDSLPAKERKSVIEALKKAENSENIKEAIGAMKNATSTVARVCQKGQKGMDGIDKWTQWNAFVQDWKDANYLLNSERYHTDEGLSGGELIYKVRDDFNQRMLPMDRFYKIFKTDSGLSKPIFMYLDSTLRMTKQTLKSIAGQNEVGVNAGRSSVHNAARALVTDFVPRTLFALARGVPLAAVFNIPQLGEDYSGIPDEDKNLIDVALNGAGQFSPIVALIASAWNNYRQDEIAKARGTTAEDLRGDAAHRTGVKLRQTFTPLGGWLDQMFGYGNNLNGFTDLMSRGYAINKNDRVQYLAPDNPIDFVRGLLYGSTGTSNAREYNNNPDLISAMIKQAQGYDVDKDGKIEGGFEDFITRNNAFSFMGINPMKSEDVYNRPATQNDTIWYSDMIKNAQGDARKEMYSNSREYNRFLDDLRETNKDAYDVYIASLDGNLVPPEKWAKIAYGANASAQHEEPAIDLSIWHMLADRAKQWSNVSGQKHDPAYDLIDERARDFLELQSTSTGLDTEIRQRMSEDPFWSDFFNQRKQYWNSIDTDGNTMKSARVRRWNELNDQYSAMFDWAGLESDDPEKQQNARILQRDYPAMYSYNSMVRTLKKQYGDNYKNAQEYKTWWSVYGDAYNDERKNYSNNMLTVVNRMREIEGHAPLAPESDSSSSKKKSGKSSSGSSSDWSYAPKFSNTFNDKPTYFKGKKAKGFTWKTAPKANFKNIPLSEAVGYNPEDLETE